jgi:hypothetical protein
MHRILTLTSSEPLALSSSHKSVVKQKTYISCGYKSHDSDYKKRLQKKHKIENMLIYYDKVISYKYDVALKICYKNKCDSQQTECKKLWSELESLTLLKVSVQEALKELDEWLSTNDEENH